MDANDDEDWPAEIGRLIEAAHAEETLLARKLYDQAAMVGGPSVYLEAGERFEDDGHEDLALKYFRKAADGGCSMGFARLASFYYGANNSADEARSWRKFVDAYVRDSSPNKGLASSSNGFCSPLTYFCDWYFAGRFHASGVSMAEFAQTQIVNGGPEKEWIQYVRRGQPDDSLVSCIAGDLLTKIEREEVTSLNVNAILIGYLKRLFQ
jgi:hypothetical protein